MHRLALTLAVLIAVAMIATGAALAQTDEFELPPVKLKPDRPSQAKPIPPSPDVREGPKTETPKEQPKEEPKPEPPKEEAEKPKEAPKPVEPPPENVPLKPEQPREGEPPTPADLPMPEPKPEPPPAAPGTLAQPKNGEVPDVPTPPKPEPEPVEPKPAEPAPVEPTPIELAPPEAAPVEPKTVDVTPVDIPRESIRTGDVAAPLMEPVAMPAPEPMPAEAAPTAPTLPKPVPVIGRQEDIPEPETEPRPTDIQAEAALAQVMPTVEPKLGGLSEVGLVEAVASARKQYERTLEALKGYYLGRGNATKSEWVESELKGYGQTPKPRYLLAAEIAGPDLRPIKRIEAADQLHEEGLHYKNYPAFPPEKKEYLKIALDKFRTIIEKYPQSDKIDEAAFRMGEIYGGWYFQDYARAIQSYERCWQWNPSTTQPARFKAAKIYEEKLRNRAKAVELYNEVISHSQDEDLTRQAQERIRSLTGR